MARKLTARHVIEARATAKSPLTLEEAWVLACSRTVGVAYRDFGIHRLITLANANDDDNLWNDLGKHLKKIGADTCTRGVLSRFADTCTFHMWRAWARQAADTKPKMRKLPQKDTKPSGKIPDIRDNHDFACLEGLRQRLAA